MLEGKTVGFIGAGNLAEALINGFIASGKLHPGRILASDRISERLVHIAEIYDVKVCNKNFDVARSSDVIFLTVKPGDVPGVLSEVAPELTDEKLIVTVAAGVKTTTVRDLLAEAGVKGIVPVVRAMPNTPVIVREGVTVVCAGAGAGHGDIDIAMGLFEAVGKTVFIEDESLMDAVTGLSGSGPAYVFLFMESLIDAGIKMGLPEEIAKTLVVQTVLGSASLARESEKGLEELRRMVTSPGGTTAAGLKALEKGRFAEALDEAVRAASSRSKELSGR